MPAARNTSSVSIPNRLKISANSLISPLLESNDVGAFSTIIGVIQDLKDVVGQVSANQEWCLRLPLMFFEETVQIS